MNILPRCRFLYIDNIRSFFVKLKLANILHTLDKHVYLFTCIQTLLILTLNTTCQTIIHVNISVPISLLYQTYHNIQNWWEITRINAIPLTRAKWLPKKTSRVGSYKVIKILQMCIQFVINQQNSTLEVLPTSHALSEALKSIHAKRV